MNKIHIIALVLVTILATSCYKDKGNYDYTPNEEITISGIEASYDRVSQVEKLTITPTVKSSLPNAEFECRWGIYETYGGTKMDTICRTQAIDYLVSQPSTGYTVVFIAKNKKTGISAYTTANLNVVTPFTTGWYVEKDDGTQTDLDYFPVGSSSNVPTSRLENIYSQVNGKKLDGKAVNFFFFNDFKSMITGKLANTRALFLTSEKDASVVNINTLLEFHDYNTAWYDPPTPKAPNCITLGLLSYFILNNGQLYAIQTFGTNSGRFGAVQMMDSYNTPYRLSKYCVSSYFQYPLFFDEISSSFVSAQGLGSGLLPVTDNSNTAMKAKRNNKTLLYMAQKTSSPFTGYAVFQDKTDPNLKIISALSGSKNSLNIVNDTIKTTDKIFNATRFTLNDSDESLIYFVVGNEVWSRNLANKYERLQYNIPAGEEITFIHHRRLDITPYSYNFVIIATKKGANYTVRMFKKTSGNLEANPTITLQGTGSVGDVIFISPTVSTTSYPPRF